MLNLPVHLKDFLHFQSCSDIDEHQTGLTEIINLKFVDDFPPVYHEGARVLSRVIAWLAFSTGIRDCPNENEIIHTIAQSYHSDLALQFRSQLQCHPSQSKQNLPKRTILPCQSQLMIESFHALNSNCTVDDGETVDAEGTADE